MSLAAHVGWRQPHDLGPLVQVARYQLPGGTVVRLSSVSQGVGWRIDPDFSMNTQTQPDGGVTFAHSWLYPETIRASQMGPGDVLYADAIALNYQVNATAAPGSDNPQGGNVGLWLDVPTQPNWYNLAGGAPGEENTSTIRITLVSVDEIGNRSATLAEGDYTMTTIRV